MRISFSPRWKFQYRNFLLSDIYIDDGMSACVDALISFSKIGEAQKLRVAWMAHVAVCIARNFVSLLLPRLWIMILIYSAE